MYAIVEIAGKQYRVEKDQMIKVPLLAAEVGGSVEFERVLMAGDESGIKFGKPVLEGAKVSAKVLAHGREKKIIVFKKKRRKGYRVTRGHRQQFTRIQIESLAV